MSDAPAAAPPANRQEPPLLLVGTDYRCSPLELRELDHSSTIEVIVDPEDIEYDEASEAARRHSKQGRCPAASAVASSRKNSSV